MDRDDAIELLKQIHRMMELKGENPFRVRAFERATESIAGLSQNDDLLLRARQGTLQAIPGIGKGIAAILTEFLQTGKSSARDELLASLPAGLLELTQIPGLGPKKANQLIEKLSVQSLADLEYACHENRVRDLPGFGQKTQEKILAGIHFVKANQGKLHLMDAIPLIQELRLALQEVPGVREVTEVGEARRRLEVLSGLSFLTVSGARAVSDEELHSAIEHVRKRHGLKIPLEIVPTTARKFGYELARRTASAAHWQALGSPEPFEAGSEQEFYERIGLPWIAPELRETGEEVRLARTGELEDVLPFGKIRGVFHVHTDRSDGSSTLEELVVAAKGLGYEYIGISDHSQSAFYARGLKPEQLKHQEREIQEVQGRHPEIRIFRGIESDILVDGSLDYSPEILERFDFVVASIHSRFAGERMTERIIRAIENPATRFLGHLTGRLLLGRPGYELDVPAVIRAAKKQDVAIEINCSPSRLDIDWRWGPELRAASTLVSVNPDAHHVSELENVSWGENVARKALLPRSAVVNSWPLEKVEKWLKR